MIRMPYLLQRQIHICASSVRAVWQGIINNAILNKRITYIDRRPRPRCTDALKASVASADVPSNELIVVIRGRRTVLPSVEAP
jgi:hypothetical protein